MLQIVVNMNIKKRFQIVLLILALTLYFQVSYACSMYKVTVGNTTMVGCNEDAWRLTSRIWFENATNNSKYGAGFTGSRIVSKNKFAPQSGMNEVGLAFSRLTAFHPKLEENIEKSTKKITDPIFYLKDILHNCKTVEDVQEYIAQFDYSYFLTDVFIYVDQSGKYLIVEPYKLTIGNDPYYVLGNFCPTITKNEEARNQARYRNGEDFLKSNTIDASLAFCTALSDTMHVSRKRNGDGTLLTAIWDLKNGTTNLFFYHDYHNNVQFNLKNELLKGDHIIEIPSLFPTNTEFERLATYTTPFNNPALRILLLLLGGFFTLSSLYFLVSYFRKTKFDQFNPIKLVLSGLGIFLTYYMFVLATNIGIYYFDAPYQHYNSKLISLSSYLPFLLIILIIPLSFLNIKIIKNRAWSLTSIGILTINNIFYISLIGLFVYWGLFDVLN